MSERLFSIAPAPYDSISTTAIRIFNSLEWLERMQVPEDGSWGTHSTLEKVIATCHSVMTFLAVGLHQSTPVIARGIDYLTSGNGAKSDWSFWRHAPLLNLERYRSAVQQDLSVLEHRIRDRAAPHKDQLLEVSYLKAAKVAGIQTDPSFIRACTARLVDEWKSDTCWRGRPDTTAHVASILEFLEYDQKATVLARAKEFLIEKAVRSKSDPGHVSWGRNVMTAYVLMSIAESDLWHDERLQELADRAKTSLLLQEQSSGGWMPEEPPYGGNEEIKGPEYFSAAVIRAIVAVESRRDPTFPLQIQTLYRKRDAVEIERLKKGFDKAVLAGVDARMSTIDFKKLSTTDLLRSIKRLNVGSIGMLLVILGATFGLGYAAPPYVAALSSGISGPPAEQGTVNNQTGGSNRKQTESVLGPSEVNDR